MMKEMMKIKKAYKGSKRSPCKLSRIALQIIIISIVLNVALNVDASGQWVDKVSIASYIHTTRIFIERQEELGRVRVCIIDRNADDNNRYSSWVYYNRDNPPNFRAVIYSSYSGEPNQYVDTIKGNEEYLKPFSSSGYLYTAILQEYVPPNTNPIINILNPTTDKIINNGGTVTIQGTVTDIDNDNVIISAAINGKMKTSTITGTSSNKAWTLSWTGAELAEGKYSSINITANDEKGGTDTKVYTGAIIVDKTNPKIQIRIK